MVELIRFVKESLVIFHVCAGDAIVEGVAYRLFPFSFSQNETFQLSSIGVRETEIIFVVKQPDLCISIAKKSPQDPLRKQVHIEAEIGGEIAIPVIEGAKSTGIDIRDSSGDSHNTLRPRKRERLSGGRAIAPFAGNASGQCPSPRLLKTLITPPTACEP